MFWIGYGMVVLIGFVLFPLYMDLGAIWFFIGGQLAVIFCRIFLLKRLLFKLPLALAGLVIGFLGFVMGWLIILLLVLMDYLF